MTRDLVLAGLKACATTACVIACAGALEAQAPARRAIAYTDLAPQVREWLAREHPDAAGNAERFEAYVRRLDQRNRDRREAGDGEHLVYFILQSTQFTDEPPIEPALSAKAFFVKLTADERRRLIEDEAFRPPAERLPEDALRRARAFVRAGASATADARIAQLRHLFQNQSASAALERFRVEYVRAMRFLFQKEFPQDSETAAVAALYQERGFSTDTAFEANFAVYLGLGVLEGIASGQPLNRVLIVGPGLDLAPRTGFIERFPPQSYQPLAVADALLSLGLADRSGLKLHAVDINDRVVRYLEQVHQREITTLAVLSGIRAAPDRPFMSAYREYFRDFGGHIGESHDTATPAGLEGHLFKSIRLDEAVARSLAAHRLDIVTERFAPSPEYDLIVVTNVLSYFSDVELSFALANMASMLRTGGYLVHNEVRSTLPALAGAHGLTPIHSRSVLIATASAEASTFARGASADKTAVKKSLYDIVWIHRKESPR